MKKENIVLLSGLLCTEVVWKEVSKLLEKDFEITIISFKGYESIEEMAKKVLDNSPYEFILIGHSMGGRVALEAFRQQSSRIKALGLFNTGVHPKKEAEVPVRKKLLDLAQKEGIASVCKQWLPPMMGETALNNNSLVQTLENMVNSYSKEEFSKQIQALLNRPNASSLLANIKIPTLLLSASEDKWSPIEQHAQMQKQLKDSILVEIKDAGHFVPVEKPLEVVRAITTWIKNKV